MAGKSMRMHVETIESPPEHPGEVLRKDVLPRIGMAGKALARHLGVGERSLRDLLAGRRHVSLDMARRLGEALGTGAHYWLALQLQHDVWLAETAGRIGVRPIALQRRRPGPVHSIDSSARPV